jgi:hypothetical protein
MDYTDYIDFIKIVKDGVLSFEDFIDAYPELNTRIFLSFYMADSDEKGFFTKTDYVKIEDFFEIARERRLYNPSRFFNSSFKNRIDLKETDYIQYLESLYTSWRGLIRNYKPEKIILKSYKKNIKNLEKIKIKFEGE